MTSDQCHREGTEKCDTGIEDYRQKNGDYGHRHDVHVEQGSSKGDPVQAYYTQKQQNDEKDHSVVVENRPPEKK